MNDLIYDYYSGPQQFGGALPYFEGQRQHQIGGSFLGNIGRFLLPILKSVGKQVLGIGAETAHRVINKDSNIKDAAADSLSKRLDQGVFKKRYKQRKKTKMD